MTLSFGHAQKTELEQVDEMLVGGIILVAKDTNSWHFCVDYKVMNSVTIKTCFPIPIIDELLVELKGAVIFSKMDLHSRYHQIRMHEADIHKIAFRTHEEDYEFTVMPFGLTNAPATFQALMNSILKPLLCKSIIVFFDDILVFSGSMEQHATHLTTVFEILRTHQLKLEPSKCFFGQSSMAYLGHIMFTNGVTVDPSKILVNFFIFMFPQIPNR